jgi:hypothetical protein
MRPLLKKWVKRFEKADGAQLQLAPKRRFPQDVFHRTMCA